MKKKLISGLLKTVALLPLPVLYLFADFIFFVVFYVVRYRRGVVENNLTEAFPEKSEKEIRKIGKAYYHYMCDIIVETVKLLHISDREMKRRVKVINPEVLAGSVESGKSVVLLLGHYGNWEWVQEISRYMPDKGYRASIYRPLNSKLWDAIYHKIRSRWNVNIIPQKSAVKTLLSKDNQPWICGFIADARPRNKEEEAKVEFLNHDTYFIYGPEVIGRKVGADFYFLEMRRVSRGKYEIEFHPLDRESTETANLSYPLTRAFWREFEKSIKNSSAYWLWSHKRWK